MSESDDCKGSLEEEYLQEYLERVADNLKISSPKYSVEYGSKKGDNYVAVVYRVTIEGRKDGESAKVGTIFKVAPTNEIVRQLMSVTRLFPREDLYYTKIVPVFEEFLKTKNKHLENVPQCYFSNVDDHKEAICLEDLRAKGFVMRDRMKQLDFAHASIAFRALGRLHAISFALRDQRPEIFQSEIAVLKEAIFIPEVVNHENYAHLFNGVGNLLKPALAQEGQKYSERFTEYMKDALHLFEQSNHGSLAEPYAVLCHGDFWSNNMLFKYDEDSREPRDIYLLDFQLARFASPATDLSYCLFCCCNQELRAKHFDELIKIYHDSLSAYLLELGSDPEKLFPLEALVEQLEKFSTYGAGMAMLALMAFTSGEEDQADLTEMGDPIPKLQERFQRDHFWRNTLLNAFKDLIDRNYIACPMTEGHKLQKHDYDDKRTYNFFSCCIRSRNV